MRKLATVLVTLAAAATLACSTMTTAVDYDHTISWSNYKTFQVMVGTQSPITFTQKEIDDSISQTLVSKGLQPTTTNPNLLVYPHVVLTQQKQWNTMSMGGFGYRGWGGMGGDGDDDRAEHPDRDAHRGPRRPQHEGDGLARHGSGPGFERGSVPGVDQQGGSDDLRELPAGAGQQVERAFRRRRPVLSGRRGSAGSESFRQWRRETCAR